MITKLTIVIVSTLGILGSQLVDAQSPDRQRGDRQSRMQQMLKRMPINQALDADGDGELSSSEIEAAVSALKGLDKNNDGKIETAELAPERGRGGRGGRERGGGGRGDQSSKSWQFLSDKYDKNKDGKITADEYDRDKEVFNRLDTSQDGEITQDDLRNVRRERRTGSAPASAPKAGEQAPDFELTHIADPAKVVKLSSFANEKPVALIFGSCT